MSGYAIVLTAMIGCLAARGFSATALALTIGVFVFAGLLNASYAVRRRDDRVLAHRAALDRVVQLQWVATAVLGMALVVGIGTIDSPPLQDVSDVVQALIVGVAVGVASVYASALIDWYWVLPKISGMVGLAPCERVGGEGFAGVTKIWFFHRAAATTVVTFVLAGVPGYLAGQAGSGGEGAALAILGSALAIGYNSVGNAVTPAFRQAFNPRLLVGDLIRVRAHPEDPCLTDAYVVDVSIQGLKYKVCDELDDATPRFVSKGTLLRIDDIQTTNPARDPKPMCPGVEQCRAVNWYCFRNPIAYAARDSDATSPAPWTPARAVEGPKPQDATWSPYGPDTGEE